MKNVLRVTHLIRLEHTTHNSVSNCVKISVSNKIKPILTSLKRDVGLIWNQQIYNTLGSVALLLHFAKCKNQKCEKINMAQNA